MGHNQQLDKARVDEGKTFFTRKGRRADEDIEQGIEEYHALRGDERATRLFVRGRRGGRKRDC